MKNLIPQYENLSKKERLILLGVLNRHGVAPVDMSTLAFTDPSVVMSALKLAIGAVSADGPYGRRAYTELLAKFRVWCNVLPQGVARITRRLNDGKVANHFGPHPERGMTLNQHVKRVTVGTKTPFGRAHTPDDDVHVHPVVALKKLPNGDWEVSLESKFLPEVERFLIDNCM